MGSCDQRGLFQVQALSDDAGLVHARPQSPEEILESVGGLLRGCILGRAAQQAAAEEEVDGLEPLAGILDVVVDQGDEERPQVVKGRLKEVVRAHHGGDEVTPVAHMDWPAKRVANHGEDIVPQDPVPVEGEHFAGEVHGAHGGVWCKAFNFLLLYWPGVDWKTRLDGFVAIKGPICT